MVDVSDKPATPRRAVAEATVKMDQETLTLVIDGGGPKGDVLSVAELAGIMAAKRTAELIPLCHPLPLTEMTVEITPDRKAGTLVITRQRATTAQTGVEMEAMTAVSVAALTVYDMVKSADRFVTINGIRLMEKSGGNERRLAAARAQGGRGRDRRRRRPRCRPARASGGRAPRDRTPWSTPAPGHRRLDPGVATARTCRRRDRQRRRDGGHARGPQR